MLVREERVCFSDGTERDSSVEKIATTSLCPVVNRLGEPRLHSMAQRAAGTDCALLLTGETGTGKGHLARWIHDHSARSHKPFVPVNCGAIPESLVDSHLFGHARGAFSGAGAEHLGLVRAAVGGTILFDEVSELPMTAQTRLLRLLEEREVQPVGYSRPVRVDVRIMAATNGDLSEAVRDGRFRKDLYFRLDVVRVPMLPLRERMDEIVELMERFNSDCAELYRQPVLEFTENAVEHLLHHSWPGNIRELRSVVERLHVLRGSRGEAVSVDDLVRFGQLPQPYDSVNEASWALNRFQELKSQAVADVLEACRGNVSRAAVQLGVHRSTIYRWLSAQPVSA